MACRAVAIVVLAVCAAHSHAQAPLLTSDQAIAVAAKDLDRTNYKLEAVLHQPSGSSRIPTVFFEPNCHPEISMLTVQNLPIWQVDAKLTLKGPGVRGWNLRYFVDANSGKVVAECRL